MWRKRNWGDALLDYLYRRLDMACQGLTRSIGGLWLLLLLWSWMHLPPLVHYLPERHSFSVTGVHRTVIVVRLLTGKNLIIKLNQSIDENIYVITNLNLN
jgi:hypothetical protein